MIRKTAAVLVVAALLLTGCEPEGGTPRTERRPGAGQQPARPPAPEANQPGPAADPGQCNQRGERAAELIAHWTSEKADNPKVLWTHNGVTTPATNLRTTRARPGARYDGEWSRLVTVKCGDTLAIEIKATASGTSNRCAIVDLGDGPVRSGRKGCLATYVVP